MLDGAKDAGSQPRALYPLDPGRVKVALDKGSFPHRLSHYEFTLDGHRTTEMTAASDGVP